MGPVCWPWSLFGMNHSNLSKLAIAANSFNLPSETFIRDHVRIIAPELTVLLARHEDGTAALSCPVLMVPIDPNSPSKRRKVVEFLRQHNVGAMLAEYAGSGFRFLRVCRKANIRLYVHVHGYDVSVYLRNPVWVSRYQKLFTYASGIIAPSRFLANQLADAGCPPEKLHVSPIGVDPKLFRAWRRRAFACCRCGQTGRKEGSASHN